MTPFTNIENEQMIQLKTKLDFSARCHIIQIRDVIHNQSNNYQWHIRHHSQTSKQLSMIYTEGISKNSTQLKLLPIELGLFCPWKEVRRGQQIRQNDKRNIMQILKQRIQILTEKPLQKKIRKSIVDYESFKMETVQIST